MLRIRRLLLFASQLDERSRKAFETFPKRQAQAEVYLRAYVDASERYNGGIVTEGDVVEAGKRLDSVCGVIAGVLGMQEGAAQRKVDLKKFAEGNDRRGFKLLRDLFDPEKDFKSWRKSQVYKLLDVTHVAERLLSKD
jgi:hypothetical protein